MATEEVSVRISASDEASPKLRAVKSSVDSLETSTRRAEASTRNWGGAYDKIQSSTRGFHTALNQTVDRGVVGLGALTVAGIGYGLKTASSFEQSNIALGTLLGSQERGTALFTDLQSFAAKTPFQLQGVTQATQRLLAYGFTAKEVLPTLTAIGDASAGLGGGQEGVDIITRAFGQIKAKGRIQGDDLRQFQEAGVPALDILAKGLNQSGAQVTKAISANLVTADIAIPILLKGMEKRFGGLMEKQSKTLGGQVSNFKDTLSIELAKAVQPSIPKLTAELPAIAASVGKAIDEIAPSIPPLVDSLVQLAPVAVDVAGGFVKVVTAAAPMVTTVQKLTGGNGIQVLLGGLLGLRVLSAAGGVISTIRGLAGAFQALAVGEAAATAASKGGVVPIESGKGKPGKPGRSGGGNLAFLAALPFIGDQLSTEIPRGLKDGDAGGFLNEFNPFYQVGNGLGALRDAGRAVSQAPGKFFDSPRDFGALGSYSPRDAGAARGGDTHQYDVKVSVVNPKDDADVQTSVERALQNTVRQRRARA